MERLLPLASKREAELRGLFTHTVGLDAAPEAYRMFAERRDGCVKVALRP